MQDSRAHQAQTQYQLLLRLGTTNTTRYDWQQVAGQLSRALRDVDADLAQLRAWVQADLLPAWRSLESEPMHGPMQEAMRRLAELGLVDC